MAKVPENVIVVLDEAYTEFTHPSERVNSFALLEKYPNLIVSRSLSKAYGLAGLRIGYAVSNPEIADLLNRVRQPFNCNSLALTSAIAVMNDDAFVEKVAENNRQEMKRYEAFCQQYGLDFIPSKVTLLPLILNSLQHQFMMHYYVKASLFAQLQAMACQITYVSVLAYHKKMTNFLLHLKKCLI